ncbi:centromere-associated protein E-like isoform X2 [Pecten maximus]|uniref:centromere-associated protein E-like isoform X2 n=1 Tax=Pecten maximus TaxID=6579 RepID=UPI00145901FE|nr:centromere-associated protein E-like isoform X2 [Pecten maximus]
MAQQLPGHQHVYTVKTLKEVLTEAKVWESSKEDFAGICKCIERYLNRRENLENIKPFFKNLDKRWKKVHAEYGKTKSNLCNPSYLLKYRQPQLVDLSDLGYISGTASYPVFTSDTTVQEKATSEMPISKVAEVIEKLTNELELEKKRMSILEEEKRGSSITLQTLLDQCIELEDSLSTTRKGKKTKVRQKEDGITPGDKLSVCIKESLKRCEDNIETLKHDCKVKGREITCLTGHTLELHAVAAPVSSMIDSFKIQWHELTNASQKKKKGKGKAKKSALKAEALEDCTKTSASDVIKSTSQALSEIKHIFPKIQELMECQKEIRDMESWISASANSIKSGIAVQLKCESSSTNRDSLLEIPHKIWKQMEIFFNDYLGQCDEISGLKEDIHRLQQERTEIDVKCQQIEQDHAKQEQGMAALLQLKQNMEDAAATTRERQNLQQTIHQLKEELANRQKRLQHVVHEKESLSESFETEMLSKDAEIGKLNEGISSRSKAIEDLKTQNGNLLNRISKQAEARLTDGNHDITDLSDPNRPTNLAEKFSELYDNEWTEAFDEVTDSKQKTTKLKDKEVIAFLLDILCVINEYCRIQADTQWRQILGAVCQQSTDQEPQIPAILIKDLRNVRKLTGNISAEGVIERFFASELSRINQNPKEVGPNLKLYIQKCVELCWLMCTQNPPLFLYKDVKLNDHFEQDYFRFYTCGGTNVDFLVWPALLCNQNGNLLRKGVCQGLKKK